MYSMPITMVTNNDLKPRQQTALGMDEMVVIVHVIFDVKIVEDDNIM